MQKYNLRDEIDKNSRYELSICISKKKRWSNRNNNTYQNKCIKMTKTKPNRSGILYYKRCRWVSSDAHSTRPAMTYCEAGWPASYLAIFRSIPRHF